MMIEWFCLAESGMPNIKEEYGNWKATALPITCARHLEKRFSRCDCCTLRWLIGGSVVWVGRVCLWLGHVCHEAKGHGGGWPLSLKLSRISEECTADLQCIGSGKLPLSDFSRTDISAAFPWLQDLVGPCPRALALRKSLKYCKEYIVTHTISFNYRWHCYVIFSQGLQHLIAWCVQTSKACFFLKSWHAASLAACHACRVWCSVLLQVHVLALRTPHKHLDCRFLRASAGEGLSGKSAHYGDRFACFFWDHKRMMRSAEGGRDSMPRSSDFWKQST